MRIWIYLSVLRHVNPEHMGEFEPVSARIDPL